jgi:basic amino acid/polyamine antiporter, APA family
VLSFIVAGLACAFAAFAYSEFSAMVGGSGSAYGYSYAAFGELMAWIVGWDLILEYGVAVAAVANGWAGYFNNALHAIGLELPLSLTRGPWATGELGAGIVNLPALVIVLLLTIMLIIGVKQSAKLNTAMVFIKLSAIVIFLSVGIFHIDSANWTPFAPFGWFSHDEMGKPIGIFAGASVVFFAYVGFDAVSTATEEAKDPQRDIPKGILASLIFCTLIYIVVSGVLTGIMPYSELNVPSPVAYALEQVGIQWASALVAAGVIAGLSTVMLVLFYGLTRIITAMGRDGLLPKVFAEVNPKTQTPVKNTLLCGVLMAVMAGFIPLGTLAELVNIGTLFAFVLVCLGVIVLRYTQPDAPRPFKIPAGIFVCVLGALSCSALIFFLPHHTYERFAYWLLAGLVIYFAYGFYQLKSAPGK